MPPRYLLSLSEAAARWSVSPFDVVTWALEELLALSVALPPVRIGPDEFLSGLVDVEPAHILPLFRREGAPARTVTVRCVKASGELRWIVEPAEGIVITAADVFIRRAEVERFDRIFGGQQPLPKAATRQARGGWQSGPGAPLRHDWDSFYAALVRRIHEHGVPSTQAELVREMRDWFERRNDDKAPDPSTIARKIRIVWQELHRS